MDVVFLVLKPVRSNFSIFQGAIATVDGLEQGYVVCPSEKRFLLLFTFLKKNRQDIFSYSFESGG